jgi:predicted enzyme related to lactoylglutathione lyase
VMVDGPGPTLCFHEIERGRAQGKIHLDVAVADRSAERRRVLDLGASVVREAEGYTVMADPEGNHFCLVDG